MTRTWTLHRCVGRCFPHNAKCTGKRYHLNACKCWRPWCGWHPSAEKVPGYAALILMLAIGLALFAVVSLDAAERDDDEGRTFHAMTVTELANAKPGSDIPTHVDVAGLVVLAKHERDGDRHLKICEDSTCAAFIVAECIPEFPKPCQGVRKGQWVRVKGISRYDGHHRWSEVHPVESLEILP